MAEIKKIATRESYGNALKELASEGADKLVVLDADLLLLQQKQVYSRRNSLTDFLTAVSPSQI